MTGAPLGLALTAGMLAAVNPCGFAMLPAYLSLLVAGPGSRGRAIGRALAATAAMTAGFAAVFGVFGLLVAPVAGQVQRHLPVATIAVGILLAALGIWLVTGRELPGLRLPQPRVPALRRNVLPMAGFGVAYAVASLTCTIGPFLAIVVTSFRADSVFDGVALFLAYAAGMGLTVAAAALAVALARESLVRKLRRAGPVILRLSGVLLLVAGGYVAYYGWWETRVRAGSTTVDPIVSAAGRLQRWLAGGLDSAGITVIAVVFAALLAVGLAAAWIRRRGSQHG